MAGKARHGCCVGGVRSKEYQIWTTMIGRCTNPNDKKYGSYGARGIYVCAEWRTDVSVFLRDMGLKPSPDHSIDRIDNDGPYSKDNCRWATRSEQQNNRRNNVLITAFGDTKTIAQWARDRDIKFTTIKTRLRNGLTPEQCLSTKRLPNPRNAKGLLRLLCLNKSQGVAL